MAYTIIHYYGDQNTRCGYCKGQTGSISHGMHAVRMMPADYQDLIDRGWRRSGHYCYKPKMQATCCPSYTIKCDALNFKLSKSHKKILKRMNRFLREGVKETQEDQEDGDKHMREEIHCGDANNEPKAPNIAIPEVNLVAFDEANKDRINLVENNVGKVDKAVHENLKSKSQTDQSKKSNESLNPPPKKAKQIRLERRQAKLAAKGISTESLPKKTSTNKEKSLLDYLNEPSITDRHQLKTIFVNVDSSQFKSSLSESYALYEKYQLIVHNDPSESVNDYLEFLQKSPLKLVKNSSSPPSGYGSFHQQYWLDDKLIAVGVIDILPYCISSVYFFYDPDYSFLSLGTYGSLREIALVQQLSQMAPSLKYYYMGFYIHSCPKMRYKGKLVPSYLLCPEAYTWHLFNDDVRLKLDQSKYQRLEENTETKDKDEFKESDLDNVLLLVSKNTLVRYGDYIQITGEADDRESILEYAKLVGKPCAHRMIFIKLDDD